MDTMKDVYELAFLFFICFAGFTIGWHVRGGVGNTKKQKDKNGTT